MLDRYTPAGYVSTMQNETKPAVLKRLKRIEGQVRGLARMVEEDRYCIDVVTQISAARAALARVESDLLRRRLHHCVHKAMTSRNSAEQERGIDELVDMFRRQG